MNSTVSTNNCMRSTNIFTLTRGGETTYVAVPFRCRSLKCQLCGAEIIQRLQNRINFYAREDHLDFFITLTSSSTKKREALQELEKLWKNIRKNMSMLDQDFFVAYRIQQNAKKYNTSNATLAYEKYLEKCKQADIQTQIAKQARQHALITVAKAQHVNYSRLPSFKKVEFRTENEQRINNLYNLFMSEHDDTYATWEQNATKNIDKIYERTFDIQQKMKEKQEKISLKYVRTIEIGSGGHYHYHILSNQPISQHMINKYTVSGENNVYDCQLINSEQNNTVKYITKYLTKAADIDLKKAWISGSKGYKLLSDQEDEDDTDENENEKWEYKQSVDVITTSAQQFASEEELDEYIEDHLFADTNDQSIVLRSIIEDNFDLDEAQHISYIRARIIRLPKQNWNYTTILDESHLHSDQITAIKALEKYSCVLINGAAGTGKTSIIPFVASGYAIDTQNLAILAPTGKAAEILRNKINTSLKDRVMTIHSFLSYTRSRKFLRSDANIHKDIKLIIVDETSMINASLFAKLLQSVPWDTKIICFGDSNQLPSVENGTNFVQELQHVRGVHTINLNFVHRNQDTVLALAHRILAQDLTVTNEMHDIDMSKIVELINMDWQVLTNRKAIAQKINAEIQQNKECPIVTYNGNFSLGDKIIISNNSKKNNIFNGQIGYITEYSNNILTITLTNEQQVTWTQKEIISRDLFQLAYAITIHRSQGSEYDNVLIIAEKSKFEHEKDNLNTNALLYTAITRAKKQAMMMCDESLRARLILNKVNSFDFSSVVRFLTRQEIEMLKQPHFSQSEIEHLHNTSGV